MNENNENEIVELDEQEINRLMQVRILDNTNDSIPPPYPCIAPAPRQHLKALADSPDMPSPRGWLSHRIVPPSDKSNGSAPPCLAAESCMHKSPHF